MKNLKSLLAIVMTLVIVVCLNGCKSKDYDAAVSLYDSGDYSAAISAFDDLEDYKDSADRATEAKKALNAKFSEWFNGVTVTSGKSGSGITLSLKLTDYAAEHFKSALAPAFLIINDVENLFTNFSMRSDGIIGKTEESNGYNVVIGYEYTLEINFEEVTTKDFDSLTLTIEDNNNEEITLIYYP